MDTVTAGELVRFSAMDGVVLAARIFGERRASLPLICLPGLSRNSRDFIALGATLSHDPDHPRQVIALDYRGRGYSEHDADWQNYTVPTEARDVLAAVDALGIEHAFVLGTSRGGLISMVLGSLRPTMLAGIIMNDIGPVIEGKGLARIKAYLGRTGPLPDWNAAIEALKRIHGTFFTELGDEEWRAFAEAIYRERDGGLHPDFDPQLAKALQDIDLGREIPDMWPQFESLAPFPLFVIRGENSDLLSTDTVEAMEQRHPGMERMTVPNQGHAPHLSDSQSIGRIGAFALRCEAQR